MGEARTNFPLTIETARSKDGNIYKLSNIGFPSQQERSDIPKLHLEGLKRQGVNEIQLKTPNSNQEYRQMKVDNRLSSRLSSVGSRPGTQRSLIGKSWNN